MKLQDWLYLRKEEIEKKGWDMLALDEDENSVTLTFGGEVKGVDFRSKYVLDKILVKRIEEETLKLGYEVIDFVDYGKMIKVYNSEQKKGYKIVVYSYQHSDKKFSVHARKFDEYGEEEDTNEKIANKLIEIRKQILLEELERDNKTRLRVLLEPDSLFD